MSSYIVSSFTACAVSKYKINVLVIQTFTEAVEARESHQFCHVPQLYENALDFVICEKNYVNLLPFSFTTSFTVNVG